MSVETGRITTDIPARLDRLPWARWHWMVVIGLGTVWILDGLEVTIVGSMSDALKPASTGLGMSSFQIGFAGAAYVAGRLPRRAVLRSAHRPVRAQEAVHDHAGRLHGRHRADGVLDEPDVVLRCRFFTGAGIGGEYAAINSAIDELIPARYRGRVDVAINGSFWVGAAAGALLTIPLLDPTLVDPAWAGGSRSGSARSWRSASCSSAATCRRARAGCSSTAARRRPRRSSRTSSTRSPRRPARSSHDVSETITIRQRKAIGIALIAKTVFTLYPKRTVLCFSLFVGQAFLYNAFFFTYGDTLTTFLASSRPAGTSRSSPLSNFLGALLLSPLFDTVGRVRMITGTYIVSGVLLAVAGFILGDFTAVTLTLLGAVIFFFASAGASAAYLTASEIFPMETRALCIAFFYAIGTAAGGITGPLLFGWLIDNATASGDITKIAIGYFIGAALMIAGGVVEAFLGVKAEGQSLESIAKPLTAEDADTGSGRARRRSLRTPETGDHDMPMPPPKASTEGPRDRQVFHEMGQIVRALEVNGPQRRTGSPSWSGRRTGSAAGSIGPWPSSSRTGSPTARRTGCWRLPEAIRRPADSDAERRAVRGRSHTQGAVEVAAQGGRGAHAAAGGDLLDGGVGAFEELLRARDALLVQPVERTGLELGVHPAGELPGAEAGLPGEVAHGQGLVEAGSRPLERRRETVGAAGLGGGMMNCACPPLRWAGTTSRRAIPLAAAAPRSRRTRWMQRSSAAVLPAEVSTSPSSM